MHNRLEFWYDVYTLFWLSIHMISFKFFVNLVDSLAEEGFALNDDFLSFSQVYEYAIFVVWRLEVRAELARCH